jgi:hypothetical protein
MANLIKIKPVKVFPKNFTKKDGTQGTVYHLQLETPLFGQKYVSCWDAEFVKNLKTNEEIEVEYTSSTSGQYTNITVIPIGGSKPVATEGTKQSDPGQGQGNNTEILQRLESLEKTIATELDAIEKKISHRLDTFEVSIDTKVNNALEALNAPPIIEEG